MLPLICIGQKNILLVWDVGAIIIQGFDCLVAGFGFVDRMFCFICQSWYFAVAINFGRYLRMSLDVNPVQVMNNPLSMDWIQVDGTEGKYVWWEILARSNLLIL